ncbi:MAG: phosphoglucosamine mutase [Gemmatimonadota bacterium]
MTFEIPKDLMVSVSGVRGRVGEALTPEIVTRFAAAFGAWIHESAGPARVVVARDSRTSGPMFLRAVTAALQSVGHEVIQLGLAPTPTTLLAIRHHGAAGAIVVTASHNPVEWNALKFASADGMFLDGGQSPAMLAFLSERPVPRAAWDELGDVRTDDDAVARHIERVLAIPFLDVDALRRRRFRVALDCIRGAGAVLLPPLLEALGCEVDAIHTDPDGRFHRKPEPVAANLGELEARVRSSGADIGFATDPDGDRLALVDDRGAAIGEDFTLALAAALVLRHRTGPVVTNLSTSRLLDDVADAAGVTLERAPVGEINVARAMQAAGAVVGGEGNGGVILPEIHLTRDSAVAVALVLQLLLEVAQPLHRIVASYGPYTIVKATLPRLAGSIATALDTLEAELNAPRADRRDGLRLDWPEDRKWLHLRPSGTEPLFRIIAEAPDAMAAEGLVARARTTVSGSVPG